MRERDKISSTYSGPRPSLRSLLLLSIPMYSLDIKHIWVSKNVVAKQQKPYGLHNGIQFECRTSKLISQKRRKHICNFIKGLAPLWISTFECFGKCDRDRCFRGVKSFLTLGGQLVMRRAALATPPYYFGRN